MFRSGKSMLCIRELSAANEGSVVATVILSSVLTSCMPFETYWSLDDPIVRQACGLRPDPIFIASRD